MPVVGDAGQTGKNCQRRNKRLYEGQEEVARSTPFAGEGSDFGLSEEDDERGGGEGEAGVTGNEAEMGVDGVAPRMVRDAGTCVVGDELGMALASAVQFRQVDSAKSEEIGP